MNMDLTNPRNFGENESLDRIATARLLLKARQAGPKDDEQLVDWAFAACPDSPAAMRMKITSLLHHGDHEAADAHIAVGLLRRPTDASLTFLRAHSLFLQKKNERADREIRLVLLRRPTHVGTIHLAARIASKLGEFEQAVILLRRILKLKGPLPELLEMLAEQLLLAGNVSEAAGVVNNLPVPSPLLKAKILRAQNRLDLAVSHLEDQIPSVVEAELRDGLLHELIDLLDELGHWPRVSELVSELDSTTPRAMARAAEALLALGRFDHSRELAEKLSRDPRHDSVALPVRLVAATLGNDHESAHTLIEDLERLAESAEPAKLASCWQHGLMGRIMLDQQDARKSGADSNPSLLRPYLKRALEDFDLELTSTQRDGDEIPAVELQRDRSLCLLLLDEPHLAIDAFEASRPMEKDPSRPVQSLFRAA